MKDRVVQYPNRYKLTPVSGDVYDLTPEPGIVTEPGTDLNKANLLSDATSTAIQAAIEMLTAPGTPSDALAAIASVVGANGVRIATGSYAGTGTYGASNPNSLTFDFAPALVCIPNGFHREYSIGQSYGAKAYYATWLATAVLTTTWLQGVGLGDVGASSNQRMYAKKSANGKIIYWYTSGDWANAETQLNSGNITYYYFGIG